MPTEKDLAQYAKNGTQDIGDLIFEDYNKDGTIDVNDYQLVGNYQPDFTFGWNNTFIYKDFDLAVTIDGQSGGNFYVSVTYPLDIHYRKNSVK